MDDDPLESKIEKDVAKHARKLGWLHYKWQAVNSHRSVPDRLFFRDGVLVIIEFKRKNKNLTKLQAEVAANLAAEGFLVHKIDNVKDGKLFFDDLELTR